MKVGAGVVARPDLLSGVYGGWEGVLIAHRSQVSHKITSFPYEFVVVAVWSWLVFGWQWHPVRAAGICESVHTEACSRCLCRIPRVSIHRRVGGVIGAIPDSDYGKRIGRGFGVLNDERMLSKTKVGGQTSDLGRSQGIAW
jgi:hypothetical protein